MGRVKPGINDLYTWCINKGEKAEHILNEWVGAYENRTKVDVKDISFGSNKIVYWKCSNNHYWLESVNSRTNQLNGCPICSGKRIAKGYNDLETWCKNNNMEHLINEWVGLDDSGNVISIHQVSYGMKKKVKWKCKYGHEWYASILNRTQHNSKCPVCTTGGLKGINDLETWCKNNRVIGDKILMEWTGETDKNEHVSINEIKPKSNTVLKWRCDKGHEWYSSLAHRTLHDTGCPYCSNRKIITGYNDLETYCKNKEDMQHLLKEWVGLDESDNRIKMSEFSYGSGKRVKWKCKHGHIWITSINHRIAHQTGCTYCNSKGTSYPEQLIYWALKQIYPDALNRFKAAKSKEYPQGIEHDIFIPSIKTCIEYSPTKWHTDRIDSDKFKRELCKRNNVRFIEIIEDSYNNMEHNVSADIICFYMEQHNKYKCTVEVLINLLEILNKNISEIDLVKANKDAYLYLQSINY